MQKSLAEGFGLTVAEAMWKARQVVASRIDGIQDQIVHGETGILLDDPLDLAAYGAAVRSLLENRRAPKRSDARRRSACATVPRRAHLTQAIELYEQHLHTQAQDGARG